MVWTSANGPKCPVSPEDRGDVPTRSSTGGFSSLPISDAMVQAGAEALSPGAFETDDFGYYTGMPLMRREARKRAREIIVAALSVSRPQRETTKGYWTDDGKTWEGQ